MGESHILDDELPCTSAGSALRHAREAAGLDLAAIGELTKIPERHLQTIEDGRFSALPARAYAVGFARTYARAVGLDEREVAQMVREELDGTPAVLPGARMSTFEAGDPARVPSSRFAWLAAGLGLAVLVAGLLFWRNYYSPAADLPPIVADAPQPAAPPVRAAPAIAAPGQVVLTATAPNLWVRVYEAGGPKLVEKSLAQGEQLAVPPTAKAPLLWTAHPEALTITVDGRAVPPLATSMRTMKDVPVDARTLLARANAPAPSAQASAPALAAAPAATPHHLTARVAPVPSPAPAAAQEPGGPAAPVAAAPAPPPGNGP